MKTRAIHIVRNWPFFLVLLPLFYLLHGLSANYAPLLTGIALKTFLLHAATGILISILFLPLLKSISKAALFSFLLLFFNYFFSYLQDGLIELFGRTALWSRYIFLLPLFITLFAWILIHLKRMKNNPGKLILFLNTALFLLLVLEVITFTRTAFNTRYYNPSVQTNDLRACDTCNKPSLYVIVVDEYAGKQELRDIFSYDNTPFENELEKRGFHIMDGSRSNYNQTIYSIASAFSMDYLRLNSTFLNRKDLLLSNVIINSNSVASFFSRTGYKIVNHSMFDFNGIKKAVFHYYLPPVSEILTFQTFTSRFTRESGFNFIYLFNKSAVSAPQYQLYDNNLVDSLTRQTAAGTKGNPVFVYSHFLMPHAPYAYNSEGRPFSDITRIRTFNEARYEYVEYLKYTNKKMLSLFDHILAHSKEKPIIVFVSDHGFRQLNPEIDKQYHFMNIAAVHLPSGNYSGFYDGITPVNIFRQVLNAQFGQQLPLLKDSTIFIPD